MEKKLEILVVDDEKDMCWVLEKLLEDVGHRITKAHGGDEAIGLAREVDFDLAFIDIRLVGMDGFEAAETIEKINPGIKVVMVSGYYYHGDKALERCKGRYGFIAKPFDLEQIYEAAADAARRQTDVSYKV